MDLLQMSVQGAAMILAVVVVRWLFLNRLPKAVFMVLWAVVMVRLLVPFDIPLSVSVWSLANRAATSTSVAPGTQPAALPGDPTLTQLNAYAASLAPAPDTPGATVAAGQAGTLQDAASAGLAVPGAQGVSAAADTPGLFERAFSWLAGVDLAAVLWVVGLALLALFFVGQYLFGLNDFKLSVPARHPYAEQWLQAHPLRRPLVIKVHDTLQSPMTYGLFKPVILVPKTFDWEDRGSASYMLLHEWVHVWRWDAVYKLVLTLALALHWFNPLVWVMYFLANRDIELACDERVVRLLGPGGRKAYAHTLIDMAEKNGALAPLASGFGKSAIEERIVAIVNVKKMTAAAAVGSVALAAGITVAFAASPAPVQNAAEPGVPNPGSFVQSGGAGAPGELVTYEVYMEQGCGATRVVTPWYSVMFEDALFAGGFTYGYDEAGLGFYSDATTEACSVLRVYDAASGDLAYIVYLASEALGPAPAPFAGDYAVAQGPRVEGGFVATVARPFDPTVEGAREQAQAQATALRNRLSSDTATHLVRDPVAGTTAVEGGQYSVAIPNDLFPQGWCYVYDPVLYDYGEGLGLGSHLLVVPAGQDGLAFGVHLSNGAGLQDEYAAQTLHTFAGGTVWDGYSVVAYKPADFGARTYNEELALLEPYAACVEVHERPVLAKAAAYSVWDGGDLRIVTPYYGVLVPGELVGAGFEYLYAEGLPAASAQGAGFFRTHITEVYLERTTGNVARFDVYCYSEGVESGSDEVVEAPTGLVSGDALGIGANVPASDDAAYDASAAEAYALTVGLSQAQQTRGGVSPGMVNGRRALVTVRNELVQVAQEAAGTRLTTPFYSVLVPADMLAEGWTYSYDMGVYDLNSAGVHLRGNTLSFYEPGCTDPTFYVHCASTGWNGVVGAIAASNVGASQADPTWDVVVCRPFATNVADLERGLLSYEDALAYVNMVGGYVAAA